MNLYAQQGYGKGDRIHIGFEKDFLDGVVLSPRDERKGTMKRFIDEVTEKYPEKNLLFDPQFYYALYIDGTSKNLDECDYYPGNINLSELRSFKNLNKLVADCIDYQLGLGLKKVVSPNILIPSFSDRRAQIALSLSEESISYANELGVELYISLIFKESCLNETRNLNDFLNELTTLEAEGFYITVDRNNAIYNQNFDNETTLTNLLTLLYSLSEINEYKVIMGYTDIIGILFAAVGVQGFSTGWYNSSRKFTEQQRILPSSGGRLPRERYTSIPLLNSILMSEVDSISQQFRMNDINLEWIMSDSEYEKGLLKNSSPSDGWTRAISYLQHWSAINNGLKNIFTNPDDISDRLDDLEKHIEQAIANYTLLNNMHIQLEMSSRGNHLGIWKRAIEDFRNLHHV